MTCMSDDNNLYLITNRKSLYTKYRYNEYNIISNLPTTVLQYTCCQRLTCKYIPDLITTKHDCS